MNAGGIRDLAATLRWNNRKDICGKALVPAASGVLNQRAVQHRQSPLGFQKGTAGCLLGQVLFCKKKQDLFWQRAELMKGFLSRSRTVSDFCGIAELLYRSCLTIKNRLSLNKDKQITKQMLFFSGPEQACLSAWVSAQLLHLFAAQNSPCFPEATDA